MSRREKDLLPSFNEVFRRSPRMCSCIGRSCIPCPYPAPGPLELGVSYRSASCTHFNSATSTMEPMLNEDIDDRVTFGGNLANYDQYSVLDAEVNARTIDKSRFRVDNFEDLPGSVNSNQENTEEVLRFFGLSEYPISEPEQAAMYMYSGETAERDVKPQDENDGTAANINVAKPLDEVNNRAGTSAEPTNGERNAEAAMTDGAGTTGSTNAEVSPYNFYTRPLTPLAYPEGMDLPQHDEMFNMTLISNLFIIDYKAFKPDYKRDESEPNEYYDDPPRFTLRNRDDLKEFLTHLLMTHNLNEPDMMFNVEVSALMLHNVLARHSDKAYLLKVIKALLMNDVHTVFKLVDFRDGFETNVKEYKFMNTEDSSSEDSDADPFCLGEI